MRISSKQFAKKKGSKFISTERQDLHATIKWLKVAHPNILFFFDYGADALLTPRQAKERKDLSCVRGWPELIIFSQKGKFCGLAIDLKRDDVNIFNSKGLYSSDHVKEQAAVMARLEARGWDTGFVKGFDGARQRIEQYLALK